MKTYLSSELPEGKPMINLRTWGFEYRLGGVIYLWNGIVKGLVRYDTDTYK